MRLDRARVVMWLRAIAFGVIVVGSGLLADLALGVVGGSLAQPVRRFQVLALPVLAVLFAGSVLGAIRHYLAAHGDQTPPERPSQSGHLAPDIHEFTGRSEDLQVLRGLVSAHERAPQPGPLVVAIHGPMGTGKSVLAIRFAHELRGRYPDAHLYVDLKGSSDRPLEPAEALHHLARGLARGGRGIAAREYRAGLRNKRAVIVLDNAAGESQVRGLIPRAPACVVLITSRQPLDELEGCRIHRLDRMSEPDAIDLLDKLAHNNLRRAEHQADTKRVAELCAYLPLALSMAGVQLRSHTARQVAARLDDERSRLHEFDEGQRGILASLDLSYRQMSPDEQTIFRRLKLLPEPSFDAGKASALLDCTPERARNVLDALVDKQVLEWGVDGRYGFTGLIGAYANAKLENEELPKERDVASERALRRYLDEATRHAVRLEPAIAELAGEQAPSSASLDQQLEALDWFDRECPTLITVMRRAAGIPAHDVTWRVAAVLVPFFDVRGHRVDWADLQRIPLVAARATGRLHAQVWTSLTAGHLAWLDRQSDRARWRLDEALQGAMAGGWRRLQARALYLMGRVDHDGGDLEGALGRYRRAAGIFADEGDLLHSYLSATLYITITQHERGEVSDEEVLQAGESVLAELAEAPEDLWGLRTIGWIRRYLGRVAERAGDLESAGAYWMASEQAFRRIGFRQGLGLVLRELGRIRQARGDTERAGEFLEESVAIFEAVGDELEAGEGRRLLATAAPPS